MCDGFVNYFTLNYSFPNSQLLCFLSSVIQKILHYWCEFFLITNQYWQNHSLKWGWIKKTHDSAIYLVSRGNFPREIKNNAYFKAWFKFSLPNEKKEKKKKLNQSIKTAGVVINVLRHSKKRIDNSAWRRNGFIQSIIRSAGTAKWGSVGFYRVSNIFDFQLD